MTAELRPVRSPPRRQGTQVGSAFLRECRDALASLGGAEEADRQRRSAPRSRRRTAGWRRGAAAAWPPASAPRRAPDQRPATYRATAASSSPAGHRRRDQSDLGGPDPVEGVAGQEQLGGGPGGQPGQHGGGDHRRDHAEAHLGERERGVGRARPRGRRRRSGPGRRPGPVRPPAPPPASGDSQIAASTSPSRPAGTRARPNAAAVSFRSAPEQKTGPVWREHDRPAPRRPRPRPRARRAARSISADGQRVAVARAVQRERRHPGRAPVRTRSSCRQYGMAGHD